MSQDIQLRMPQSNLPVSQDDVFSSGALSGGGPTPVQKVHRLLRGRYGLAITLGLLGGTVGAVAGWFSQRAEVRSEGLVQIEPIVKSIVNSDKTIPFYDKFLASQPYNIMNLRVIQEAMASDDWKRVGWPLSDEGAARFKQALEATSVKNTQHVSIAFTDTDPIVAQTGVRATVKAYAKLYADMNGEALRKEISELEAMRDKFTHSVRNNRLQIQELGKNYGSEDLSVVHDKMQGQMVELQGQVMNARIHLDCAETAWKAKEKGAV